MQVDKKISTNVKTFANTYNITLIPSGGPKADVIVPAGVPACLSVIYPIDAVLIPASIKEQEAKKASLLH